MIGGVLGFVGLGKVSGSQNATARDVRSRGGRSLFWWLESMELWGTPVDGAFEIRDAAAGVAAWRIGRLISVKKSPSLFFVYYSKHSSSYFKRNII